MKIHRYIYTRLEKEESPRGKAGFQSAYWPENLLDSGKILDIESHIHYPENLPISGKNTLFYLPKEDQDLLVVLFVFPQLAAKDQHGRTGIFLCEGFILEEKDWNRIPNLLDLIDFLEDKPFRTLDRLNASTAIDKVNGFISPLEFEIDAAYWDSCARAREEDADPYLLMALYHQAKGFLPEHNILIQGEAAKITEKIALAASYLPMSLRKNISWDAGFDDGKIFFSQLGAFGFQNFPAIGGKQIRFTEDNEEAEWTAESLTKFSHPTDTFSHWLMEVSISPPVLEKINSVYQLAETMRKKEKPVPSLVSDPIFEAANEDEVRSFFKAVLGEKTGAEWAAMIAQMIPLHEQMEIWIADFPVAALQRPLLAAILHHKVGPNTISDAPPSYLLTADQDGLRLMESMWTGKAPDDIDFQEYGETEVCEWLTLLLKEGDHKDLFLKDLLPKCLEFLRPITRNREIGEKLMPYLKVYVPESFADFAEEISIMAVRLGEFGCLVGKPIDWYFLTERWLVETGGHLAAWKAIKAMRQKPEILNYVIFRAFCLGEHRIPMELEHSSDGRKGFLMSLIQVHGLNESQLLMMGFLGIEIRATGQKFNLWTKFKRMIKG